MKEKDVLTLMTIWMTSLVCGGLQRVRARQATSNPTSPLSTSPRRPVSACAVLDRGDGVDGRPAGGPACRPPATNGRRCVTTTTTPPAAPQRGGGPQHDRVKRASDVSMYDNITLTGGREGAGRGAEQAVTHRPPPYPNNIHRPIAEREIPYDVYHEKPSRTYATLPAGGGTQRPLVTANGTSGGGARPARCSSSPPVGGETADDQTRCTAVPPGGAERRQASRTLPHAGRAAETTDGGTADYDNYPTRPAAAAAVADDDDLSGIQLELRGAAVHGSQPVLSQSAPPAPRPPHSAEWPPLPTSPHVPDNAPFNTGFDSTTLKRMLQTLPEVSPPDRAALPPAFHYNTSPNTRLRRAGSEHLHCLPAPVAPPRGQRGDAASEPAASQRGGARDSYRDSGIGSLTNDTASSIKSGGSERSAKSSTLPSGEQSSYYPVGSFQSVGVACLLTVCCQQMNALSEHS